MLEAQRRKNLFQALNQFVIKTGATSQARQEQKS